MLYDVLYIYIIIILFYFVLFVYTNPVRRVFI